MRVLRVFLLAVVAAVLVTGCGDPAGKIPGTNLPNYMSQSVGTPQYPLYDKIKVRDGTNCLGLYEGMIAERSGWADGSVEMFSATSGECLKWIPATDFTNIFVTKTKPEYQ